MSFAQCPRILSFLSYKDQQGVRRRLKPQDINLLRIFIDTGTCWKNTETLAKEANMSVGAVSESKKVLSSLMYETNQPLIFIGKISRPGGRSSHIIELNTSHPAFKTYSKRLFGKETGKKIQDCWLDQFDSKGIFKNTKHSAILEKICIRKDIDNFEDNSEVVNTICELIGSPGEPGSRKQSSPGERNDNPLKNKIKENDTERGDSHVHNSASPPPPGPSPAAQGCKRSHPPFRSRSFSQGGLSDFADGYGPEDLADHLEAERHAKFSFEEDIIMTLKSPEFLCQNSFTLKDMNIWLKKYEVDSIFEAIDEAKNKKPRNPAAYVNRILSKQGRSFVRKH